MSRRHNPLRVKLDATYTAFEIAHCCKVHIRTVRDWIANGLTPIDGGIPRLFHGRTIRDFLYKLNKPRQPLQPGEFYCVACKGRALPARGEVWLTPRSVTTADFTGDCSQCARTIYRRVRLSQIDEKVGPARLVHKDGEAHVSRDGDCPRESLLEESLA